MKKVITPATKETAVYYSDFSGKCFDHFGPNAEVRLSFNYGSKYDSEEIDLHLSDEEAEQLIDFIKSKLSKDCIDHINRTICARQQKYDTAVEFRDWGACNQIKCSLDLLKRLTQ